MAKMGARSAQQGRGMSMTPLGFNSMDVFITLVGADGRIHCVDRLGKEYVLPRWTKGGPSPRVGESWIISRTDSAFWNFATALNRIPPAITGSRHGNPALTDLLQTLHADEVIKDETEAGTASAGVRTARIVVATEGDPGSYSPSSAVSKAGSDLVLPWSDAAAPLQAAVDAATGYIDDSGDYYKGGIIFMHEGDYRFTTTLDLPSGWSIQGSGGQGTNIVFYADGEDPAINWVGVIGSFLRDFNIVCGSNVSTEETPKIAIRVYNGYGGLVSNIWNAYSTIRVDASAGEIKIRDCYSFGELMNPSSSETHNAAIDIAAPRCSVVGCHPQVVDDWIASAGILLRPTADFTTVSACVFTMPNAETYAENRYGLWVEADYCALVGNTFWRGNGVTTDIRVTGSHNKAVANTYDPAAANTFVSTGTGNVEIV